MSPARFVHVFLSTKTKIFDFALRKVNNKVDGMCLTEVSLINIRLWDKIKVSALTTIAPVSNGFRTV